MNTSISNTLPSEFLSFCQRRYDRLLSKADLMDQLADIAMKNGENEVASVLRKGADDLRDQVENAAQTVSEREQRILSE